MIQPIPAFDHNAVLPPHLGNPTLPSHISPYPCTTIELCRRFGTSEERREILRKYLDFRAGLHGAGILRGFQWLDGSFLEDVESREGRSPRDLDLLTIYWGYDREFLLSLKAKFPAFSDHGLAKAKYSLDHYELDAGFSPGLTVDMARYWALLFSHTRNAVWKGMLKIDLDTGDSDSLALAELGRKA